MRLFVVSNDINRSDCQERVALSPCLSNNFSWDVGLLGQNTRRLRRAPVACLRIFLNKSLRQEIGDDRRQHERDILPLDHGINAIRP